MVATLFGTGGPELWAANADFGKSPTTEMAPTSATAVPVSATKTREPGQLSRIDALVSERVQQLGIPGYCLGILQDGKVVFQKGYGVADLEKSKERVTPDTIFGLASITKTFTALTLLSLVDQGKVNVDETIDKYLDSLPDNWKKLTIRQLASMSSGIRESRPGEVGWEKEMKIVEEAPLLFEPGTMTKYSNPSYRTLGSIIEKVTGKSYLEAVVETICTPLGLHATGTQISLENAGLIASPYVATPDGEIKKIKYRPPDIGYAAGMLFSNVSDMLKYGQSLLDGKLLTPSSYKILWYERPALKTGAPCPWAFGWGAKEHAPAYGNQYQLGMNGGIPGMASTILIFPQSKTVIVAMSNLREPPVYEIVKQAAKIYFGADVAAQDEMSPGTTNGAE